jgi:hypothetical protein
MGRVGIATSSPYFQLSVNGATASSYFNAYATTSTSTLLGGLYVGSSSPSLLVSNNSGKVSIGTTTDLEKLTVEGNIAPSMTNVFTAGSYNFNSVPASAANVTISGTGGALGTDVSSAGDVNGDGINDVMLGDSSAGGGTYRGQVYIFFGTTTTPISYAPANADVTITGTNTSDYLGDIIAPAGDINGDGFADIILTSRAANSNNGEAYVFYGGPNFSGSKVASSANVIIRGDGNSFRLGEAAGYGGDLNGDGFDDIVVTSRFGVGGNGAAYIFFGKSNLSGSFLAPSANVIISGDADIGDAVSSGDVNGDGYSDLMISQKFGATYGQVFVYFGGPNFNHNMGTSSADVTINGISGDNTFGTDVSTAGDVNGDGFDDIIVGARNNNAAGSNRGQAYVFYGGQKFRGTYTSASANLTISGSVDDDKLGYSVASAGDLNGDGFDDILIGAGDKNGAGTNRGEAYVFYGSPTLSGSKISTSADVTLYGSSDGSYFGRAVSSAGDINADGIPDILVGAIFANKAYIFTPSGNRFKSIYAQSGSFTKGIQLGGGSATLTGYGLNSTNPFSLSTANWSIAKNGTAALQDAVINSFMSVGTTATSSSILNIAGFGTNDFFNISSSTNTQFIVKSNGNVGVGTSSPFTKFGVTGDAYIAGNLTATGTLTVGTLTGPLQAINGVVSATGTMSIAYGGTGTSTTPSYGKLLVGNSLGGYDLLATSSLGFTASQWTTNGSSIYFNTGNVGIGSSSPYASLSIVGAANQTNPFFAIATSSTAKPFLQVASSTNFQIDGGVIGPVHKGKLLNGVGGASLSAPFTVFVQGSYAYLSDYDNATLEIVDISNPAAPVHKGKLTNGTGGAALSFVGNLVVSGNYAYLASQNGAFEIVDISNPAAPVHKGKLLDKVGGANLYNPHSLAISGNYAYVIDSGGPGHSPALEIIDISNPALPQHKGKYISSVNGPSFGGSDVDVSGPYAYVTDTGGNLLIFDVSDPRNIVLKSTLANGTGGASLALPKKISVVGNYAYIVDQSGTALEIVDISNPSAPVHKGKITDGTGGAALSQPEGLFISGNYAYVGDAGNSALEIIDISNPASPKHAAKIMNGQGGAILKYPYGVFVSGNYAYVADSNSGSGGLEVIDVGALNVSNAQIGTLKVGNLSVDALAQFNNNVLVKNGLNVGGNAMIDGVLTVTGSTGTTTANIATTSAVFLGNVLIGTPSTGSTTPYSRLTVFGQGTGTGQLFELANSASTTVARFLDNGTGYFAGNIGFGTTSPFAKVSISANNTDTYNHNLFNISSTTGAGVTSTLFSVLANGNVNIGTLTGQGISPEK